MLFIPDLLLAAIATYLAYAVFTVYRSVADWRLSLYGVGMLTLAIALIVEALVEFVLFATGIPGRFIRREEVTLRTLIQLLYLMALIPIAIAVTPSAFYVVPIFILVPVNVVFSIYIAIVTLIKSLERRRLPWISLAFFSLALSLVTPLFTLQDFIFRFLTAVFLLIGVLYAEKAKQA